MNKLKLFDLIMFSILSVLCEFLSIFCFKKMHSGFYISFASLLFLILSIRWGSIAAIPFMLAGIPSLFLDPIGIWQGIIYYLIANGFAAIPIFLYRNKNRNEIIKHPERVIIYVLLVLVSLSFGKGLAILIINKDLNGMLSYLVSMIFTFVINLIVIMIFIKSKSQLVYDMNQYLKEGENYE